LRVEIRNSRVYRTIDFEGRDKGIAGCTVPLIEHRDKGIAGCTFDFEGRDKRIAGWTSWF
jgi:hypothetical protein